MQPTFYADAAEFLLVAGPHLAASPVVSTVVATIAERAVAEIAAGIRQDPRHWYAVVRDGDEVVGAAMRTAPFEPRPLFLLPMPAEGAVALARALHDRGEYVRAANGALPTTEVFARETARLLGRGVAVGQHTRLFELGDLVEPPAPPGRLRAARPADIDLALAWFDAFMADADEQAGREPGTTAHESLSAEDMLRRIELERIWLWEDEAGDVVHLTGRNAPAFGVARIGPVYTPRARRGRGYASATVALVSRQITAAGDRACLFTDQANPTSNRIYEALGYRRVVDMANLVLH
jgi:GNAT superfamily N-acetyltransferase